MSTVIGDQEVSVIANEKDTEVEPQFGCPSFKLDNKACSCAAQVNQTASRMWIDKNKNIPAHEPASSPDRDNHNSC
jgi:hypothetical protein